VSRRATFSKAEIVRAVSAINATGLPVTKVEIDSNGKITIETGAPKNAEDMSSVEQLSPLQQWQVRHAE